MIRSILFCASLWATSSSIGIASETATSFEESEKQGVDNLITTEKPEELDSTPKQLSEVIQPSPVEKTEYQSNRLVSQFNEIDWASRLYGNSYSLPQTTFGSLSNFFTPAPAEDTITRNFFQNIGFSHTPDEEEGTVKKETVEEQNED